MKMFKKGKNWKNLLQQGKQVGKRHGKTALSLAVALSTALVSSSCKKKEKPAENKAPVVTMPDTIKIDANTTKNSLELKELLLEGVKDDYTKKENMEITSAPAREDVALEKNGITNLQGSISDDGTNSLGDKGEKQSTDFSTVLNISGNHEKDTIGKNMPPKIDEQFPDTLKFDLKYPKNTEDIQDAILENVTDDYTKKQDLKITSTPPLEEISCETEGTVAIRGTISDDGKTSLGKTTEPQSSEFSTVVKMFDSRELVTETQKLANQTLLLDEDLPAMNLLEGLKPLDEKVELSVQKILRNGTEISGEDPSAFVPMDAGEYKIILQASKGEKTKTLQRSFTVEHANKTKITKYPKGELKNISRRYAKRDWYNDFYWLDSKSECKDILLEKTGEARATAQAEYIASQGTREHPASWRQERLKDRTIFMPESIIGAWHGLLMKQEILTKNALISEDGSQGMNFVEWKKGDREGLKKKLQELEENINNGTVKYYIINASRKEGPRSESLMESSVTKDAFKSLLATGKVIVFCAAGNTGHYYGIGGWDVLALEGDPVGLHRPEARQPFLNQQGTQTAVPQSLRDPHVMRFTCLSPVNKKYPYIHNDGSVKVLGGDSFASVGAITTGTSGASAHETGEFPSQLIAITHEKGDEVSPSEIVTAMRKEGNFSQGIPKNKNTRLKNIGEMMFRSMINTSTLPSEISLGGDAITIEARVGNVYITALSPQGNPFKLCTDRDGKFVTNRSNMPKDMDYHISPKHLKKLGYQPGDVLKIRYSALSDRSDTQAIEERSIQIPIVK